MATLLGQWPFRRRQAIGSNFHSIKLNFFAADGPTPPAGFRSGYVSTTYHLRSVPDRGFPDRPTHPRNVVPTTSGHSEKG
ncbi:hypothetical protein NPIL_493391 [Nephila pilipes]|uniref:Uncharacterized protein n=1 Tax=Nephila pilipes TaxID=299642 RepID=A0A8X6R103_NEPPI|nr:hypothetical protein NPIL_493391 [Nephila pilipes]